MSQGSATKRPLRVLLVEDSDDDELLVRRELSRGDYDISLHRVETAAEFVHALRSEPWDILLSDYSLPHFGAPQAIEILNTSGLDLPILIVSGTIGEDTAVEAMRAGANDFLVKHRLARLLPAIARELRESEARRAGRRAETSLAASERRFRAVAETAADGIVSLDGDGAISYANSAAATMFGYSPAELCKMRFLELAPEHKREEYARRRDANRTAAAPRRTEQGIGLRSDGVEFPIEVSFARWTEGDAMYVTAIVRDTSERKKIEAQLMVSDRMASVGTLAAGVAHEINNPLAAVVANLEIAEEEARRLAGGSELVEVLNDAKVAADRVRNIVKDLKLFSRADDDTRGLVDVEQVLESSLRIAATEIRHRARLVRDYQPIRAVIANESRLSQVFLNLIVNAAQAIPEGRADQNEIRIATRPAEEGRVVIEIADTGAGMTEAVVGRLFTPFFTTKPPGEGTGLGLSICQRIVSSLDGHISVESAPGKGTLFRVVLPGANREKLEAITARPAEEPLFERGRVLVVDDESLIASVIERVLKPVHDVVVIMNAREALRRIAQGEHFDVILCDVMMPTMSGAEFYEELSRRDARLARAIVFLSGGAFTAAARAFLESVPNARMEKPFDALALRAIVGSLIA